MTRTPFSYPLALDLADLKRIAPPHRRHLSGLRHCFADQAAVESALAHGDPILYETCSLVQAGPTEDLLCDFTIMAPGKVGAEYYMTRGHFNAGPARAEFAVGIRGRGLMLLRTKEGEVGHYEIEPGGFCYIPATFAHRAVNTGSETFVFVSICAGDTGHDYATTDGDFFARAKDDGHGQVIVGE